MIVETYRNGRVKLPLRESEPSNQADRGNYREFESRSEAEAVAYRQEHEKFGHDTPKFAKCPVCPDAEAESGPEDGER
jgi:hypothetical protein